MKRMIFMSISILLTLCMTKVVYGGQIIYIADPSFKKDVKTTKTQISLFNADGTEIEDILVDGIMARVSPDGKRIAYIENLNDVLELVIADAKGKKIRNLPIFLGNNQGIAISVANLVWSPDGEKIAILRQQRNEEIYLNVIFLKTDKLKRVLSVPAHTSEEAFAYPLKWVIDSKRLILGTLNGLNIVDITANKTTEVMKNSAIISAYAINDGELIVGIATSPEVFKAGVSDVESQFKMFLYDLKKNTSKLTPVMGQSPFSAISHDGKYLAFQGKTSMYLLDISNKKTVQQNTKNLTLMPKKFSPINNKLIICLGDSGRGNGKIYYGILNLESGEFKPVKEANSLGGEGDMLYFMGFDWVDWR